MSNLNLLLLPGLLNDARLWAHQIADLKHNANCTVANLGGSDTIAGLAASALKEIPAGPFAMAGLSMGGYVALEIMRQAPQRVVALALLDTNARADSTQATADRKRMMKMAETDFERVTKALLPKLVHPAHLNSPEIAGPIKAMFETAGKEVYFRQQSAIIGRIDSRPHLAKIQVPTLILCGREDQLTPLELHEEMARAITGSRLVVAEKCGHLSTLEQPRQVSLNLMHWLSGVKNR